MNLNVRKCELPQRRFPSAEQDQITVHESDNGGKEEKWVVSDVATNSHSQTNKVYKMIHYISDNVG